MSEFKDEIHSKMAERNAEHFDLEDEFVGETEDNAVYDRLLARADKRARSQGKRGKAAWSRLEEVLDDKRLEKDLREVYDDEV